VIEAQVMSTSPITGQKISDISFPEGVLVGAIQKGKEVIRPKGDTRVEEGDVIVMFALAQDVPEVERLLQVSITFFLLIPATHALALDLHRTAQPFFYSALLFGILTALIGLATYGKRKGNVARGHLLTLIAAFAGLPLMLAVPMREAIGNISFFDVYFEMVSSLTTTGALVGWMGGYLILLAAIAVLAPLNLGGYEVLRPVSRSSSADKLMGSGDPTERILRFNRDLFPLYLTATMALWGLLVLSGAAPFLSLCLAMSTLATSGITPSGGLNPWQVSI